jgi:PAS domain S-box-containing protein
VTHAGDPLAFLPTGSVTADEMRTVDWSRMPIGSPGHWPGALRCMLATMLTLPQPMFLAVGDDRTFFFNDAYRPMLGNRLAGAMGRRFEDVWGDVWQDVEPHVLRALNGEGSMHRDMRLMMTRHGFSEETWWTFSYAPLRDESGDVIGMVAITNETTRAVRSATALRELNASLEIEIDQGTRERDQIWAISPDLYIVLARDGHYRNANPAWRNELGYEVSELVGLGFEELVHPDDLDRARDAVSQLFEGDAVDDLELRIRARDGSYRWFAWTCIPDGDVIYGMGRDTQRRRDLDDQQRHAHKLEALGRLTGGIAHDFNNILGGIGGAIELVSERLDSGRLDGTHRLLDAAGGAVKRAAGLTHRLLAYARQQALSLSDVDANAVVHGLELLLKPLLGESVTLDLSVQPDLWRTLSDASQLESAILNLAINARDAMPRGGVLGIRTHNATGVDIGKGRRDYVVVAVCDTGTGMSRSVAEKAFDPFFTTKAIGQGTGLGLSMVDGFARQTGGRAVIESVPGKGSTVSLWLPRHVGETTATHTHIGNDRRRGKGQHVLLVEDEPMLRSLAREVLEEAGYDVSDCGGSDEALRLLLAENAPDILVTDVGLPGMDGHQLAVAARKARPSLPVLFVTGYAWDAFTDTPVLPDRTAILSKPFSVHALVDAVAGLVEGTGP